MNDYDFNLDNDFANIGKVFPDVFGKDNFVQVFNKNHPQNFINFMNKIDDIAEEQKEFMKHDINPILKKYEREKKPSVECETDFVDAVKETTSVKKQHKIKIKTTDTVPRIIKKKKFMEKDNL